MLVQTLYILQILALGAIPLVKGQTDYGPPEDTNPKNPRQLFPKLWFYTDATCTETPSEPEILGIGDHGTDDGKCQGLNNRMSVGIEQDPEGAEVEFNNGCLLMFEKKGCKGEGVPIDLRYQDAAKCRRFGLNAGDFKSYRARAAYGCASWGPPRTIDEVDFTPPS